MTKTLYRFNFDILKDEEMKMMKIEMNRGDAVLIQSEKSTIKIQCLQNGLLEKTELD